MRLQVALYIAIFLGFLRRLLRKMLYPYLVGDKLKRRARTHGSKYVLDTYALYVYYEGGGWFRIPHTEIRLGARSPEVNRVNGMLMPVTYSYIDVTNIFVIDFAFYSESDPPVQKLFPMVREKYGQDVLGKLCRYIDDCTDAYRKAL